MNINWSARDAEVLPELMALPEELEDKPLPISELRSRFRSFRGHSIYDIVDTLGHYGQDGYLNAEIMLSTEYLKQGEVLDRVTRDLNQLGPEPVAAEKYRGLSRRLYAKVVTAQPLNKAEVLNLPDEAKNYLEFKLSGIDRQHIRKELAVDAVSVHSSRLVKSTLGKPIATPAIDPNKLKVLPSSYDKANHVLTLSGVPCAVMKQAGRKIETTEAKLVGLLFSVKYFNSGVGISRIYPVRDHKNKRQQVKNARALVAAINSKLPEVLKGQELIKFDNTKFYIHPQYKKN